MCENFTISFSSFSSLVKPVLIYQCFGRLALVETNSPSNRRTANRTFFFNRTVYTRAAYNAYARFTTFTNDILNVYD